MYNRTYNISVLALLFLVLSTVFFGFVFFSYVFCKIFYWIISIENWWEVADFGDRFSSDFCAEIFWSFRCLSPGSPRKIFDVLRICNLRL